LADYHHEEKMTQRIAKHKHAQTSSIIIHHPSSSLSPFFGVNTFFVMIPSIERSNRLPVRLCDLLFLPPGTNTPI
jgi:hypothetical protein